MDLLVIEKNREKAFNIKNKINLKDLGLNFKWAHTLKEALLISQNSIIEGIMLSPKMVESLGEENFKYIRKAFPIIPVIIVSEHENFEMRDLISKGVDDFLALDSFNKSSFLKVLSNAAERRNIISDLENSEKNLLNIINGSLNGILVINNEGKIVLTNKTARKILGYASKEISNFSIGFPLIGKKKTEIELLTKDHKVLFAEITETDIIFKDSPHKLLTLYDVTERRMLANKLKDFNEQLNIKVDENTEEIALQERKYKKLFDLSPIGIVILNKEGIITEINSASLKILGYDNKKEIFAKHFTELNFEKKDLPTLSKLFSDVVNGVAINRLIIKGKRKDGSILFSEIKATPLYENGKVNAVLATHSDITEIVKEKEQKDLQALKYKTLFENNVAGVYRTTIDGKILDVNNKFARMLGYDSIEEIKEKDFIELQWNNEDGKYLLDKLKKAGCLENIEHKFKKKDGSSIWVVMNIALLEDISIKEKIIQATVIDITHTKSLYSELKTRDSILEVLATTASKMLHALDYKTYINEFLGKLGQSLNADRAYIFQNFTDANNELYTAQKYEWVAEGIEKQINNPELKHFPMVKAGFSRWINLLNNHKTVKGNVDSFPKSEQKLLKAQNIKSLIILPIIVDNNWWGFIGFDKCSGKIRWTELVENSLKAGAILLGDAITNFQLEAELMTVHSKLLETNALAEVGYFDFDIEKNKLEISESIYKIFETNSQKTRITLNNLKKYIHPDDLTNFSTLMENAFSYKQKIDLVFRVIINKNKTKTLWSRWKTYFDEKNNPKRLQIVMMDITYRTDSEGKILKFSQVIDNSPAIVLITNAEQKIEYVNKKFSKITGYKLDELLGNTPSILSSGYHSSKIYSGMLETIYSGKEWTGELLNKKKNGELYWQSNHISPLINENGDITHFILVALDITERKKLLQELKKAKTLAEKSDNLKTEFLAQISHEIRTPLTAIKNFHNIIEEEIDMKSKNELDFAFEGIEDSTKRLIRSINEIISTSEIIKSQYKPVLEVLDFHDLLMQIFNETKEMAEEKGLQYKLVNSAENTVVKGDGDTLKTMIKHVIDNAIKYTQKGSITISLKNEKESLIIQVKDSGIGISEEYLQYMFQPFSQEDTSFSRSYEGLGLGTTLIKLCAEINKAELKVTSKKGVGTLFTIKLNNEK